jgi:uncharacterized protein (DUF1330 family)
MDSDNQTYEMLVGLCVTDDKKYNRYREEMAPILEGYGGSFRYDWSIGKVFKSESAEPLNRLFIITFPSVQAKDNFFADDRYVAVREEYFEPAVMTITYVSEYVRQMTG